MSMKNQWLLNVAMVLLAWLSLPFLGLNNVKRFLPASILVVLLELFNVRIGKKRKWWVFYNNPDSIVSGEVPFNIGPFLVGSMWILKWTYGNFKRFIFLNAIVDGAFAIIMTGVVKKIKIFTLVRINKFQFFLYIFYKAFFLYGFQYFFENRNKLTQTTNFDTIDNGKDGLTTKSSNNNTKEKLEVFSLRTGAITE